MSDEGAAAFVIRPSGLEVGVYLLLLLGVLGLFAAVWHAEGPPPGVLEWIELVGVCLLFTIFPVLTLRFRVVVDAEGIYHRELVTRFVPWEAVERIRISREDKLFGLIKRLKVEVVALPGTPRESGRILVTWREGKLLPLVELLRARFPEKVEEVSGLPDV